MRSSYLSFHFLFFGGGTKNDPRRPWPKNKIQKRIVAVVIVYTLLQWRKTMFSTHYYYCVSFDWCVRCDLVSYLHTHTQVERQRARIIKKKKTISFDAHSHKYTLTYRVDQRLPPTTVSLIKLYGADTRTLCRRNGSQAPPRLSNERVHTRLRRQ